MVLGQKSKEVQLLGRLLNDICNVIPYLLPGDKLQIKLTKSRRGFYLMNTATDSSTKFQFLKVYLILNGIRPNPAYMNAHNATLAKAGLAGYNMTGVELKAFTYSAGPQSLSINNAVLGQLLERLLFTMIKNKQFLCSLDTNPYHFQHFNVSRFTLFYNSKPMFSEIWP